MTKIVEDDTKTKKTSKKKKIDLNKIKDFIEDNPELVNKAKDVVEDLIVAKATTKKKTTRKKTTTKKKTTKSKDTGLDDVIDIAKKIFK